VTTLISNPTHSPLTRSSYRCRTSRSVISLSLANLAHQPSFSLRSGSWDMEGTSP
jgi:hypothetical protein